MNVKDVEDARDVRDARNNKVVKYINRVGNGKSKDNQYITIEDMMV